MDEIETKYKFFNFPILQTSEKEWGISLDNENKNDINFKIKYFMLKVQDYSGESEDSNYGLTREDWFYSVDFYKNLSGSILYLQGNWSKTIEKAIEDIENDCRILGLESWIL